MRRAALLLCLLLPGCWRSTGSEVVVYTALDSEFSTPVFERFTAESGVAVLPKFDVESTKTVGLAEAIVAEQRPAALRRVLEQRNPAHLAAEAAGAAGGLPAAGRQGLSRRLPRPRRLLARVRRPGQGAGGQHQARAASESGRRRSSTLADPKWRGRAAMAKPLFGTTATQAACLFAVWGDRRAKEFFRALKRNDVQILSGNKQVALSRGRRPGWPSA